VIEEEEPKGRDEEERPKRRGSFWRELPILIGVALVVAIVVRAFVLQTFYIPSESMENTLQIDDRVLVNKLIYELRSPERGEVVVFEAPPHWRSIANEKDFIKRVIAVGGDHIACCDAGRLVINGVPLEEPYLYSVDGYTDPAVQQSRKFETVVPEGRLWMMGDHRSESGDSMQHYWSSEGDLQLSTISEDAVIGRAFVLFWPVGRGDWLTVPDSFDAIPEDPPVGLIVTKEPEGSD
jgi:signal peptidase I